MVTSLPALPQPFTPLQVRVTQRHLDLATGSELHPRVTPTWDLGSCLPSHHPCRSLLAPPCSQQDPESRHGLTGCNRLGLFTTAPLAFSPPPQVPEPGQAPAHEGCGLSP